MERRESPQRSPLFSPAVSYGNLLFLSGIGAHFEGDIKAHTKKVLDDIQAQLEACGSSMNKVLKAQVYLADLKDYDGHERSVQGQIWTRTARSNYRICGGRAWQIAGRD